MSRGWRWGGLPCSSAAQVGKEEPPGAPGSRVLRGRWEEWAAAEEAADDSQAVCACFPALLACGSHLTLRHIASSPWAAVSDDMKEEHV